MDILKVLKETGTLNQLGDRFGLSEAEITKVIEKGIPEIEAAIRNNTSTPEGYDSFKEAVNDHANDDLHEMVRDVNNIDATDGEKIMGHIFGSRKDEVNEKIARDTGVKSNNSGLIIAMLLPMILSMLGKSLRNQQNQSYPTNDRYQDQRQNNDPFGRQEPRRDNPISDIGNKGTARPQTNDSQFDAPRYDDPRYQDQRYQEQRPQADDGGLMDILGSILGGSTSSSTNKSSGVDVGDLLEMILKK